MHLLNDLMKDFHAIKLPRIFGVCWHLFKQLNDKMDTMMISGTGNTKDIANYKQGQYYLKM